MFVRLDLLFFIKIIVVISRIDMGDSLIDFDYFIGNFIDQVAVVSDEADRPLKLLQGHLQYISRGNVEMTGRFVKEKKIDRLKKHLCQNQTALLSTAQHRDSLINVISTKKKSPQDGSKFGLTFVGGNGEEFFKDCVFRTEEIELVLGKVGTGRILS